jgi:hypothetical protein
MISVVISSSKALKMPLSRILWQASAVVNAMARTGRVVLSRASTTRRG